MNINYQERFVEYKAAVSVAAKQVYMYIYIWMYSRQQISKNIVTVWERKVQREEKKVKENYFKRKRNQKERSKKENERKYNNCKSNENWEERYENGTQDYLPKKIEKT